MKMRNLFVTCAFCLLSLLLLAANAQAKEKKSAVPNLSVTQIIANNVKARGGLKRWRAVHAMSMTGMMDAGKVRSPDTVKTDLDQTRERPGIRRALMRMEREEDAAAKSVQLPFVMELQRPRKLRLEITFQNQTAVQVYDGVNGWKLRPYLGHDDAEPYTPEELKASAQQQELDGPLIDYAAKGTKVKFAGVEQVEGRSAYKIRLALKDGSVRYVWVDAKTFLDVKIDGSRRLDGKLRPVATYFRNYKSVGGLMIPFLLETRVEGVKDSEKIIIGKVALNPKLGKSEFAKPKA